MIRFFKGGLESYTAKLPPLQVFFMIIKNALIFYILIRFAQPGLRFNNAFLEVQIIIIQFQ